MSNNLVGVFVTDVIGPLPDGTGLIMVSSEDHKVFPVRCSSAEAESCYNMAASKAQTPYDFMSQVAGEFNAKLVRAEITEQSRELYSAIYFDVGQQMLRKISTDSPANAINAAIAAKAQLFVARQTLDKIVDASNSYVVLKSILKRSYGSMYPLPMMDSTPMLRMMSDFLDEAMPNGTIFANA